MEHLPKPPCLYKRGNRYYLRKRIPLKLLGHYKQAAKGNFVIKALGTSDFREACRLVTREKSKLEDDFEVLFRSLKKVPVRSKRQLEDLTTAEREKIVLTWLAQQDLQNSKEESDLLATAPDAEIEEILENLYGEQAYFTQETDRREFVEGQATAKSVLEESGVRLGKDNLAFQSLSRLFTLAHHELLARSIQRLQQRPVIGIEDPIFRQTISYARAEQAVKSLTFGEACQKFREKKRAGLKPRSAVDFDKNIDLLQEFIPSNVDVSEITHETCMEVYELIKKMPAHVAKKCANKNLREAIELGQANGSRIIGLKRANTLFGRLHAILKFTVQKGYPTAGRSRYLTSKF